MKIITSLIYIFAFWIALPAVLIGTSLALDHRLPVSRWPNLFPYGSMLAVGSASMLVLSVLQFTRQAKSLPISAFPSPRIVRGGIYAFYRHPIYLFFTSFFFGIALAMGSPSMTVIVMPAFALLVSIYARLEETKLLRRFGRDYQSHQEQTGILLPRFHMLLSFPFRILSVLYFPVRFVGRDRIPDRAPFFIAANHRNYLDPFIISFGLPYKVHYVTTFEMFRSPLASRFFRVMGCIPKRRFRPDPAAVRAIIAALNQGSVIGIFPEGERSFTGDLQGLKMESLKLFQRFSTIPVVPVAIAGDYVQWPRWGRGWRRCPVTVTFSDPMTFEPGETPGAFGVRLSIAIRPNDAGAASRFRRRAHEIQHILYRCPKCRRFDALRSRGETIRCGNCAAVYGLTTDLGVIDASAGHSWTIPELYREIAVTADDLPGRASPPVVSRSCACSVESGTGFRQLFSGTLVLDRERLSLRSVGATAIDIPHRDLSSVTIEGASRLQCYDGTRDRLYQIVFESESAKKWHDLLVVARSAGTEPPVTP